MAKNTTNTNTTKTAEVILTFAAMEQMLAQFKEVKAMDVQIPAEFISKFQTAAEFIDKINSLPVIDWDSLTTADELETAKTAIQAKIDLKAEMDKFFAEVVAMVAPVAVTKERKSASAEMKAFKKAYRENKTAIKAALNLTDSKEDKKKLRAAVAAKLKELNITKPAA